MLEVGWLIGLGEGFMGELEGKRDIPHAPSNNR